MRTASGSGGDGEGEGHGPRRLRDEAPTGLERALLDAGSTYRSSAEARAKTLAALGLGASAALLPSAAAAASSLAPAAKVTWAKVLATVSVLGGAAAVPIGYQAWQGRHEAVDEAVHEALVSAPAVSAAVSAPPEIAPPVPTLREELVMLDAARSRLAEGQASDALALLDTYTRAFPRGHLGLEAEVLRIDALARSGRGAAARRRAQAFLREHPNSLLGPRVRAHLDD